MSAESIASILGLLKGPIKDLPVVGGTLGSIIDLSLKIYANVKAMKENDERLHKLAEYQADMSKVIAEQCQKKFGNDLRLKSQASEETLKTGLSGLQKLLDVLKEVMRFIETHLEVTTSPRKGIPSPGAWFSLHADRAATKLKNFLEVKTTEQDIKDLWTSLERAVNLVSVELQLQTADVASATLDGVGYLIKAVDKMNARMAEQSDLEKKIEKVREDRIKWLNVPDRKDKDTNATVAEATSSGTCDWLFRHGRYEKWTEKRGILWLQGIAGSGKTVLASAVIRRFQDSHNGPVVYHYCNVKESSTRRDVLGNLLVQLLNFLPPNADLSILDRQRYLNQLPTSDQLLDHFKTAAKLAGLVIVVIDALDESNETDVLAATVRQLASDQHVQVLATLRIGSTEIQQDELSISLSEEAKSVDRSIELYIRRNMHTDTLQATDVVKKAKGMFLMAKCLVAQLEPCITKMEREEALSALPDEMDEMYRLILSNVPKRQTHIVGRALLWVYGAQGPLTLNQLVVALKLDGSGAECDDQSVDPGNLLRACHSLVSRDKSNIVTLSHTTVNQYFERYWSILPLGSHVEFSKVDLYLAMRCLRYLCLRVSGAPEFQTRGCFKEICEKWPLVQYACSAWPKHVANVKSRDETLLQQVAMLIDIADAGLHYCAYRQLSADDPVTIEPEPAWPTIVLCQAPWLIEDIFRLHPDWLLLCHDAYTTPLILAVLHSLGDVIEALVKAGACIDQAVKVPEQSVICTPLCLALWRRDEIIFKKLLDLGADVNVGPETPLHVAVWDDEDDHAHKVDLLLGHGAKPDVVNHCHATALHIAASLGRDDIALKLLRHGWSPNVRDDAGTVPLEIALQQRSPGLVQLLLEYRARGELVNLTADDIEWAHDFPWHADLSSSLLNRGETRRLTANDIQRLFRGLHSVLRLPDKVVAPVVSMLDMAQLWISYSTSSSRHLRVTEWMRERSYLRLSVPPGSHVRAVKFVMVSHDQGWSGEPQFHGTYRGSYTWFDVVSSDSKLRKRIQYNVHASEEARTYCVTWDHSFLEQNPEWRSALCAGEKIRLVPRARYSGWVNYIRSAEIEILCAFDPSVSLTSDTSMSEDDTSDDDDDHYDHHYYYDDDDEEEEEEDEEDNNDNDDGNYDNNYNQEDDDNDNDNDTDTDTDNGNDDGDDCYDDCNNDNDDEGSFAHAEATSYDD